MGTERNEIRNIPCLCGKGRITVTFCSPDHAYAHEGQTWREDKIECSECEAKYLIVEQDKNLVLVTRDDYQRTDANKKLKERELKELEQRAWDNLDKNGDLDAVVRYLNTFKTAAAAYRHLSDVYVFRDIDDFRKKFSKHNCTKDWVRKYFYLRALEKLLNHMQVPNSTLEHFFTEQSTLSNRAVSIPQPIGEPILHLNR